MAHGPWGRRRWRKGVAGSPQLPWQSRDACGWDDLEASRCTSGNAKPDGTSAFLVGNALPQTLSDPETRAGLGCDLCAAHLEDLRGTAGGQELLKRPGLTARWLWRGAPCTPVTGTVLAGRDVALVLTRTQGAWTLGHTQGRATVLGSHGSPFRALRSGGRWLTAQTVSCLGLSGRGRLGRPRDGPCRAVGPTSTPVPTRPALACLLAGPTSRECGASGARGPRAGRPGQSRPAFGEQAGWGGGPTLEETGSPLPRTHPAIWSCRDSAVTRPCPPSGLQDSTGCRTWGPLSQQTPHRVSLSPPPTGSSSARVPSPARAFPPSTGASRHHCHCHGVSCPAPAELPLPLR